MKEEQKETGFKTIFKNHRIAALVGNKNSGKSNNLIAMILEFRKQDSITPIYAFGMELSVMEFLVNHGVKEISSLRQLYNKKDSILIIDEAQLLGLTNRKYKDVLDAFINFVYHTNCYVIFSSPQIREFNTVLGSVIEIWLLKSVNIKQCMNGSQLKKAIDEYKGRNYKKLGSIVLPKSKMLVISDDHTMTLDLPYIKEADNKKDIKRLF